MSEVSAASRFAARTLADLAATLPGATAVFRRHKLDFCCGGQVTVAEAAASKGLNPGALAAELEAYMQKEKPARRDQISKRRFFWRAPGGGVPRWSIKGRARVQKMVYCPIHGTNPIQAPTVS